MYSDFRQVNMSKTRVGLIAPCIGVGGGDALMLGLLRYCHNIEFTGVAVRNPILHPQMDWAKKMCGNPVPIHNPRSKEVPTAPGVRYHDNFESAIFSACAEADIIMSWCIDNLPDLVKNLSVPIIDYAQNTDDHARHVARSNGTFPYFKAGCSVAAGQVFDSNNVRIIHNGIDPSRCCPKHGREFQRNVWNIKDEQKVVLFMGRLVKEKRPGLLIQALTQLPEEYIAVFVGDGPELENLHEEARRYAPKRTFFVAPQYHVGDILAAADVFVLASDFEGHPLALLEAWLTGTPTVYSALPCVMEMVEQVGPLGSVVPRNPTTEMIVEAINRATSQTDEIFAECNNARMLVWQNFTLPTIAGRWEEYIEECLHVWRKHKRYINIYPVKPATISNKAQGS